MSYQYADDAAEPFRSERLNKWLEFPCFKTY
nr:MAG TPA: hypothetical protein [Caudoviricetes sp.]